MSSHAAWQSFRFSLSFYDVEELLAKRGIAVTYETICQGRLKFAQIYTAVVPICGDKWHLDEVVLTIGGKRHSLWQAADHYGNVLDILVPSETTSKPQRNA